MKPPSRVCEVAALESLLDLALDFDFSVLPLDRGWGSRNSVACGTALKK